MRSLQKVDPLFSAKVRAIAEGLGAGKNEAPPAKALSIFRIPLEAVGEDGINLNLSETGAHFIIRM